MQSVRLSAQGVVLMVAVALAGCRQPATRPLAAPNAAAVGPAKDAEKAETPKLSGKLNVFVPCAFVPPLAEITEAFTKEHPQVEVIERAENVEVLAPRIEKGAKPDVFVCIGDVEMDRLQKAGVVEDREDFCFVGLTLVVPEANPAKIQKLADLARPNVKTVAVGAEGTSPGHYTRELLKEAGLWEKVAPKAVCPKFPSQLLKLVGALNKADAAIAYAACLRAGRGDRKKQDQYQTLVQGIKVVQFLDEGEYCQSVPCPAATVKGCNNREAGQAFIDFLRTKAAQEVLRNSGFTGLSDAKCLR